MYASDIADVDMETDMNSTLDFVSGWASKTKDDLRDIEELVYSPRLGINGRIDVTMHNKSQNTAMFPLEIKTGSVDSFSMRHDSQVNLYSYLLGESHGGDITDGFLVYPSAGSVKRVPVTHSNLRGLVMTRNDIAIRLVRSRQTCNGPVPTLAPAINDQFSCRTCDYRLHCMLLQETENTAAENKSSTTHHSNHYYPLVNIPQRDEPDDSDKRHNTTMPRNYPTSWQMLLGQSTIHHLTPLQIEFFSQELIKLQKVADDNMKTAMNGGTTLCQPSVSNGKNVR